ncbi:hypothetical protein [Palleronia caenipelagi]|uniref:Bacteriophage tail tape measure N-terminal domain-containing protein n=1 Tax=Palleronia caenipelagi TaxID=2489174 RepID=A0A547Q6B2_9RHOB|nr:hypothetical protein [Palleronia caenipelagi]TRD21913.1 hypothetical protein FEV53_07640 [Palleronia caenipelagi]
MADDSDMLISAGFSVSKMEAETRKVIAKYEEAGRRSAQKFDSAMARVSKNETLKATAREIDRLARKYDPAYAASKKYQRGVTELNRALEIGSITTKQYEQSLERLVMDLERGATGLGKFDRAMKQSGGASRRYGGTMQQVGFQVGDFATQVGGGTSAMIAAGQQLPQLLGAFGAFGALAGAGVAIAFPLINALLNMGDAADEAGDKLASIDGLDLSGAKSAISELTRLQQAYLEALSLSKRLSAEAADAAVLSAEREYEARLAIVELEKIQTDNRLTALRTELEARREQMQAVQEEAGNAARLAQLTLEDSKGINADPRKAARAEEAAAQAMLEAADNASELRAEIQQMTSEISVAELASEQLGEALARSSDFAELTASYMRDGSFSAEALAEYTGLSAYQAQLLADALNSGKVEATTVAAAMEDGAISADELGSMLGVALSNAEGIASTDMAGMIWNSVDAAAALASELGVSLERAQAMASTVNAATSGAVGGPDAARFGVMDAQTRGVVFQRNYDSASSSGKRRRGSGGSRRRPTGGGGRGRAGGIDREAAQRARELEKINDALEEATQRYEDQIAELGKTTSEIAAQRVERTLLRQAVEAGIDVDARSADGQQTLRERISATASEVGRLAQEYEESRTASKATQKTIDGLANNLADVATGAQSLRDVLKQVWAQIARDILVSNVRNALSSVFSLAGGVATGSSSGGNILNTFLGGLLGGARAVGGPVAAGVPYLVNENTPRSEVFVPSRCGAVLNVSQAQAALARSAGGRSAGPVNISPATTIVIEGSADKETLAIMMRELQRRDRDFASNVLQVQKSAQERAG